MSSGRGGAGNIRLDTGSGLKGKGRANEDTITTFLGREISTVFQNVRSLRSLSALTAVPYWPRASQITRSGRGGAGNYNEPMSPEKMEQETQAFQRESVLIKERQRQGLPIGGKVRYTPHPSDWNILTVQSNFRRLPDVGVWEISKCQPLTTWSLNIGLRWTPLTGFR